MTPAEIGACSLWQISQVIAGHAKANGAGDKASAPSDDDFMRAMGRA